MTALPRSAGRPFYERLNQLLERTGKDVHFAPFHYREESRASILIHNATGIN
ncbi:MAG: hypothetical protein HY649_02850 [Acidobacteria bacterium]|nr:hypothetical protein [Acidobacteriota bacterium]